MKRISSDVKVLIGLLVFLLIVVCLTRGNSGGEDMLESIPVRSSYSVRSGGVKALYDTVKSLDYRVQRNTDELSAQIDSGVLFVISPDTELSRQEWVSLSLWVQRGNLLVVAGNNPPLPEVIQGKVDISYASPAVPSFLSPGVHSIHINGDTRLRTPDFTFNNRIFEKMFRKSKKSKIMTDQPSLPIIPMFSDDNGVVVGYSRFGQGGIITMSDGWPLSNRGIAEGGNLRMVLNTLKRLDGDHDMTVTFDEYHHGYGVQKGMMSLIDFPAKVGLAVIAIAFILLVFSASRRFGKPIPLVELGRQRGEYLSSMASLLQKGRTVELVREVLGRRFLADTATAVGVAPESTVQVILKAAENRHPEKLAVLRELCEAAASNSHINNETALLAMARRWHKIKEELTK